MSLYMTLRIAFKALGRNKLRTALTMLGMIIGVAAVIAMVALGSGAQAQIEEQVRVAGHEHGHLMPGSMMPARALGAGGTSTIPRRRGAARDSEIEYVSEMGARAQVIYGNQNWNTQIRARTSTCPSGPGVKIRLVLHRGGREGLREGSCSARTSRTTCSARHRSDRPEHPREESDFPRARRHDGQGRLLGRPEHGRPGVCALHDRDAEALRSAEPEQHHRVHPLGG